MRLPFAKSVGHVCFWTRDFATKLAPMDRYLRQTCFFTNTIISILKSFSGLPFSQDPSTSSDSTASNRGTFSVATVMHQYPAETLVIKTSHKAVSLRF